MTANNQYFENYSKQLVQMGCNRDSILILSEFVILKI